MPSEETHLLAWLENRDIKCPVCDYNLRDLQKPVCPECSAPLALAVASPNLSPGHWIAAIVFVALGAGFDGVVSVILTIAVIMDGPNTPAERVRAGVMLGSFLILTCLCVSVILWIYRSRRRWNFWPRKRRVLAVWAAFLGTGGLHALVAVGIMRLLR